MISMTPNSTLRAGSASTMAGLAAASTMAADMAARKDRLSRLKARTTKPGEASFFFYDAHFQNEAVKILPGATSNACSAR